MSWACPSAETVMGEGTHSTLTLGKTDGLKHKREAPRPMQAWPWGAQGARGAAEPADLGSNRLPSRPPDQPWLLGGCRRRGLSGG